MLWAHASVMAAVGLYALVKERAELGCRGLGVAGDGGRACIDERSVYVDGTAPEPGDTPRVARAKLISVLSYHEKGGVWKRCFLLATVLAYVAYLAQRAACSAAWTPALQHLLFFTVLYFYWNFLNYHHFRVLKRHGMALLDTACGRR